MQPECVKYLHDILDAANAIDVSTRGHTREDFLTDRSLRDAAQWNFCVIGEAIGQLNKVDVTVASRISDYQKIIGFRNQLIHGYGVINHEITWDIVKKKLPVLLREVRELIGEA